MPFSVVATGVAKVRAVASVVPAGTQALQQHVSQRVVKHVLSSELLYHNIYIVCPCERQLYLRAHRLHPRNIYGQGSGRMAIIVRTTFVREDARTSVSTSFTPRKRVFNMGKLHVRTTCARTDVVAGRVTSPVAACRQKSSQARPSLKPEQANRDHITLHDEMFGELREGDVHEDPQAQASTKPQPCV